MRRRGALVRLEMRKTFGILFFWIALVAFCFLFTLILIPGLDASADNRTAFLLTLWPNAVSFLSVFLLPLTAILIVILGTNEFQWGTAGQHWIDGLSRVEYLRAKLIQGVMVSASFWIVTLAVVFLFVLFAGGGASPSAYLFRPSDIGLALGLALALLGFASLAVLVSVSIRSVGPAIAVFAVYVFMIEPNLTSTVMARVPDSNLQDLLPVAAFGNLLNPAAYRFMVEAGADRVAGFLSLLGTVGIAGAHSIGAIVASAVVLRVRDA